MISDMEWLKSSSDITHIFVSAVVTGAVAAVVFIKLSAPSAAFVYLVTAALMLGTQCWVAFVAGPTMRANMEKMAFGDIQSRLFPKMGMVVMNCSALAITGYFRAHNRFDLGYVSLAISSFISNFNCFIFFPACTGYMFEMRKYSEDSKERKQARTMFGITHGIANISTLVSIAANIFFFYFTAASKINNLRP